MISAEASIANQLPPNGASQPLHLAVTLLACATGAPADRRLNGGDGGNMTRVALVFLVVSVAIMAGACSTSSYGLPEAERTRAYQLPYDQVWDAALDSLADVKCTVVDRRKDDGVITARSGFSMSNSRGGEVRVLVTRRGETVRVEAGMEIPSWTGDLGESKRTVKRYLATLDARLRQ